MPEQTYVVVRAEQTKPSPEDAITRGAPADDPSKFSVMTETVSSDEVPAISDDPGIVGLAPVMPVTLVSPVRREPAIPSPTAEAGTTTWGVAAVGAARAAQTGRGATVAVLDTGIDAGHPAFEGVEIVTNNFTSEVDFDTNGHGTHCAGTVFGQAIDGQRIGVAPGIGRAMIGKVIGDVDRSTEALIKGILWAVDGGAHIVSMSLGIDFSLYVRRLILNGAAERAAISEGLSAYLANVDLFRSLTDFVRAWSHSGHGVLFYCAAGNESDRDANSPVVLNATPPAAASGIVSVGAVERLDGGYRVGSFSNTQVDLVGPGVDVRSAVPGGGTASYAGTSMATPHVAGVAALWIEALTANNGGTTPTAAQIEANVSARASTECLAPGFLARDVGHGLIQAPSPEAYPGP